MRRIAAAVCGVTAAWSAPALAGEDVLYKAAPDWVSPAELDAAATPDSPLLMADKQVRLENGTVAAYSDVAYRIDSPEALTELGTLKMSWMPDKGDLTIHRLEIVRGEETIDLLARDVRYEVLRRERLLEQRSLDGSLTATVAVPGLKVGDVLRFSQTISMRDQALGGEVQHVDGLIADPVPVGFARAIYSWPEGDEVQWKAGPDMAPPARDASSG